MSRLEQIDYADRGTALTGWLARPVGPPRAAILVWPTVMNVTPAIELRAQMLADAGYLALIGDYYGEPVSNFAGARALADDLRADADHHRARLFAALDTMRTLRGVADIPVAVIGYCLGGQAVLELARAGADVRAAVSFHGVFDTKRPAQPGAVTARVLLCHGDADPLAPRSAVIALWDELDAAGAKWHFHSYSASAMASPIPASRQLAAQAPMMPAPTARAGPRCSVCSRKCSARHERSVRFHQSCLFWQFCRCRTWTAADPPHGT